MKLTRKCPLCKRKIKYKSKRNLQIAIEKNTNCKSCSNSGRNNGMFGKTHYGIWLEKYGKEEADKKLKSHRKKLYGKRFIELNKVGRFKGHSHYKKYKNHMSELYSGKGNPFYGKVHTEEYKRNRRIQTIKRIEILKGKISPNYNPIACKIIDEYGKKNGYNFQHAENGGEYHIKELGYWVDGYDKEKNVVIEYYENKHNRYKERDEKRKQEIKKLLKCKFIEIKEKQWKNN